MTCNHSVSCVTHQADDPGFRYVGRWKLGCPAVTICSGAILDFVFPGTNCEMVFDVTGMTQFPDMMICVDDGAVVRHRLNAETSTIRIEAENRPASAKDHAGYWHRVSCWTIIGSADANQWTTLNGSCKFLGVRCESPDAVLPTLPSPRAMIEFLGDSITQSLRLLYHGLDGWDTRDEKTGLIHEWQSSLDHQHPVLNWPWQTASLLGYYPIVNGFGGLGLTHAGTIGVPPAIESFPFVFAGAPWQPVHQPEIVAIYHGTNDGEFASELYLEYLTKIRAAYRQADIFAICPHPKGNLIEPIRQAVERAGAGVHFLDYTQGVIAPADTSDGCHLNPSGAMHLAVRLAKDIGSVLSGKS